MDVTRTKWRESFKVREDPANVHYTSYANVRVVEVYR